jgi:hypothetical protein
MLASNSYLRFSDKNYLQTKYLKKEERKKKGEDKKYCLKRILASDLTSLNFMSSDQMVHEDSLTRKVQTVGKQIWKGNSARYRNDSNYIIFQLIATIKATLFHF